MSWQVVYTPEASKDVTRLDGSQRKEYAKAINKVSQNPLPSVKAGMASRSVTRAGGISRACSK